MRKLTKVLAFVALAVGVSSCTLSHTAVVTNNPVGSKTGVAKAHPFMKDADYTFLKAKENGGISKVGIAEVKYKQIIIIPTYRTTVTGE